MFAVLLGLRFKFIVAPIIAAVLLRLVASLVHHYVFSLPDSGADAIYYEKLAWSYSNGGLSEAFLNYPGPDSKFYSWIISLFYAVVGRSELLAQSLSVVMGVSCVLMGALITSKIWGQREAVKVAWFLATYPTLVLYSALTMREVYIVFFFSAALYYSVLWAKNKSLGAFCLANVMFLLAGFFHGVFIMGTLFLVIFYLYMELFRAYMRSANLFVVKKSLFGILALFFLCLIGLVVFDPHIPKVGSLMNFDFDIVVHAVSARTQSDAGSVFPAFLSFSDWFEALLKIPIRVLYFLFSPFPWDVVDPIHVIGLVDSFLFLFIVFLVSKGLYRGSLSKEFWIVLSILVFFIVIFSFGVGTFGSSVRHRAKFILGLAVLAAPFLPIVTIHRSRHS